MQEILTFLSGLAQHNERDWYHAHQKERIAATDAFEDLVKQLLLEIQAFDPQIPMVEPKTLTFKLTRDTRFSHDKSPYLPAFRAHIGPQGKLPIPVGYYLMIRPGNGSFLGGGLFADMFRDATTMVRDFIAANGDRWMQILSDPDFSARFTVRGAALKNVPRGYDQTLPQAEYLKNKSWYIEFPISDAQLLEPDFVLQAAARFAEMQQFNQFLNDALIGFQMPQR